MTNFKHVRHLFTLSRPPTNGHVLLVDILQTLHFKTLNVQVCLKVVYHPISTEYTRKRFGIYCGKKI